MDLIIITYNKQQHKITYETKQKTKQKIRRKNTQHDLSRCKTMFFEFTRTKRDLESATLEREEKEEKKT